MICLHHCHQTRSMRALWLLNELGVEFDVVVHPFGKTLRSKDYLALHPVGRVPALELDGNVIWESGAITEVLCERFPEARLGRAPKDAERADWLIWVHFAETVSQHTAALTQSHIVLYKDWMRSPTVMSIEAKRLSRCFGAIEEHLLSAGPDQDFLLRSGFSAADISVGHAVYMARHFVKTEAFPALDAWYCRITARPGFKSALPPEGAERLYAKEFYPAPDPVRP
ncbi:MAG: glutathione S-transferase family protein [Pseudomonadota bacterium]